MPEGLVLPNGKLSDVKQSVEGAADASFAAAMAQPVQDVQEPPDRQERSEPPRRQRKPREQKAPSPPSSRGKSAGPVKDDYTADAAKLVQATWMVMASVGPTQPYALPVAGNADAWTAGLADGAKHNSTIRRIVDGTGESSWMLTLAAAGLSTSMQMYQIMKDPELRREAGETTKKQLREIMKAQGIDMPGEPREDVQPG
jgi:hypothetical protein